MDDPRSMEALDAARAKFRSALVLYVRDAYAFAGGEPNARLVSKEAHSAATAIVVLTLVDELHSTLGFRRDVVESMLKDALAEVRRRYPGAFA